MIGSRADHRHSDYHFQRQHTGCAPDPLPPMRPLWHEVASIVGFVLFLAVCVML